MNIYELSRFTATAFPLRLGMSSSSLAVEIVRYNILDGICGQFKLTPVRIFFLIVSKYIFRMYVSKYFDVKKIGVLECKSRILHEFELDVFCYL